MIETIPTLPLDAEAAQWARIATLARILEIECADLDDETDCWRALLGQGVCAGEAMELTPAAIRRAKDNAREAQP